MESASRYQLRTLGVGEIFDRAVTIYVRNFAVFTLMVLTLLAPYNVVQYFAVPDKNVSLAQTIDQIEHPEKHRKDPILSGRPLAVFAFAFLMLLLLSPFVAAAVAVGVAATYNEKRPEYAESFGVVLRRWPRIFGATLAECCIILGVYIVCVVALTVLFVVAALAVRPALPLAIIFFVLAAVAVLATAALFMLLLLTYAFSTYAAALEPGNVASAVAGAFRRIFNRREIGKALLIGLSYVALEIGVLIASGAVSALLMLFVKNYALQLAVNAVISSALTAFLTIVVAVYYYDVRTRAEGFDLELELQRLGTI